jgi:hypothetical protein
LRVGVVPLIQTVKRDPDVWVEDGQKPDTVKHIYEAARIDVLL